MTDRSHTARVAAHAQIHIDAKREHDEESDRLHRLGVANRATRMAKEEAADADLVAQHKRLSAELGRDYRVAIAPIVADFSTASYASSKALIELHNAFTKRCEVELGGELEAVVHLRQAFETDAGRLGVRPRFGCDHDYQTPTGAAAIALENAIKGGVVLEVEDRARQLRIAARKPATGGDTIDVERERAIENAMLRNDVAAALEALRKQRDPGLTLQPPYRPAPTAREPDNEDDAPKPDKSRSLFEDSGLV
jgi:hypothetical protein